MAKQPDKSRLKGLTRRWREEKVWGLTRRFTFGQYKGFTLQDVLDTDLEYVRWLIDHGRMELGRDAIDYMDDKAETWPYSVTDFMGRFDEPMNRRG